MSAKEARTKVRDKYRTILGRNRYSQAKRSYVFKKYSDGKYYSDCSSSIAACYRECGYPITYGGSSLPSTVGFYHSKDVTEVPVKINSKGEITNPEILRVGDCLLFAGTDSSRSGSGYVGHVEMVGEISGSKITIYGHGSGTPRKTEMQAYLRKRRKQSAPTKLGHRGLIKVVRKIQDDGSEPKEPKLGDRELKDGCIGSDVRELQKALIAQGYSCGSCGADGEFGADTKKAVKKFQTAKGLSATGFADAATIAALTGTSSSTTPTAPSGPTVTIANCKECNLRVGPGTNYKSVGTAKAGDTFIAPDTSGWVPVVYNDQVGWVSAKYAQEVK